MYNLNAYELQSEPHRLGAFESFQSIPTLEVLSQLTAEQENCQKTIRYFIEREEFTESGREVGSTVRQNLDFTPAEWADVVQELVRDKKILSIEKITSVKDTSSRQYKMSMDLEKAVEAAEQGVPYFGNKELIDILGRLNHKKNELMPAETALSSLKAFIFNRDK